MSTYYFNSNEDENGCHEIHTADCSYLPKKENQVLIGNYNNCTTAILAARLAYRSYKFDGCYYCCNECHKI